MWGVFLPHSVLGKGTALGSSSSHLGNGGEWDHSWAGAHFAHGQVHQCNLLWVSLIQSPVAGWFSLERAATPWSFATLAP